MNIEHPTPMNSDKSRAGIQHPVSGFQLDPNQLRSLASVCAAALNYRALGFDAKFDAFGKVKKMQCAGNQRKFAALLVCESFGLGQEWGQLDGMAFHKILAHGDVASVWRVPFIHKLMAEFVRNGWMVTDGTGRFRLLPDRWPNWADVRELMKARDHSRLDFVADDDLNSMLARISQLDSAQCEFFAGRPEPSEVVCEHFAPLPKPKPPDPPPGPENPSKSRSFVRGSTSLSPPVLPPAITPLRKSVNTRSLNSTEKSRSSREGDVEPRPNMGRGLCVNDPYMADKLARHTKGEMLRRELVCQVTWTARAFQQHFEERPDDAREDLGWFLEANHPNRRMNTHMQMLAQKGRFQNLAREVKP